MRRRAIASITLVMVLVSAGVGYVLLKSSAKAARYSEILVIVSPPASAACTLYDRDQDVRITFSGPDATAECVTFAEKFSSGGHFWSTNPHTASGVPPGGMCAMVNAGRLAIVEYDGAPSFGSPACGDLEQEGWTVDGG